MSLRKDLKDLPEIKINVPKSEIMMCLNESFVNPWEKIGHKLIDRLTKIDFNRYFNKITEELYDKLSEYIGFNITRENLILGNGADEILYFLFTALREKNEDKILTFHPSYFDYATYGKAVGLKIEKIEINQDFSFPIDKYIKKLREDNNVKLGIICNPNNPTGNLFSEEEIIKILNSTEKLILVDEAYFEFSKTSMVKYLEKHENLLILRSFSKGFSAAGLRFGYIIGNQDIIYQIKKIVTAFNLSLITQAIATELLDNKDLFIEVNEIVIAEREKMYQELLKIDGITPFQSKTNFILFRVEGEDTAHIKLHRELEENGIATRNVSNDNVLKNCLRVTIDSPYNNLKFINLIKKIKKS